MLDEFETKKKSTGLLYALFATKALRAVAVAELFWCVVVYEIPVLILLFFVMLVASLIIVPINRPWKGSIPSDSSSLSQILINAALFLVSTISWVYGLSFVGPTRTFLSTDYLGMVVLFLLNLFAGSKNNQSGKGTTVAMIIFAYLLLAWSLPTLSVGPKTSEGQISQSRMGSICLLIGAGLSLIQKKVSQDFEAQFGTKRLYSIVLPICTVILFPLAIFQAITTESDFTVFSFWRLVGIFIIAAGQFVANFFVDLVISHRGITLSVAAPSSIAISFVVGIFMEWWWGIAVASFSVFLSFLLLFVGTRLLFSKASPELEDKELPLYSQQQIDIFSFSFLRISMRQILENSESRRIFSYLCVNLLFMFVEMLYGVLTNSLGLISDSCHMLFDCTALVIGLYASVISKLPPNKIFSYGYGRVEVLSGFINGIFLVFIAFLVLMESAERLFHPQEINSDKLLLVSCLGLVVNLIGVFAFHDLHDHGGGDHGHSHNHKKEKEGGHSQSHGHSHEHKKEKKEGGHSHEHKHTHDEDNSNIYGVYLHIVADTLGSVGVIISSILIEWKGWTIADPICSLCISLLIFMSVIPLLRSSVSVLLQVTPDNFEKKLEKALEELGAIAGVVGWSDPHVWRQSGKIVIATIHIQTTGEIPDQKILAQVTSLFRNRGIKNLTVEITHQPKTTGSITSFTQNF